MCAVRNSQKKIDIFTLKRFLSRRKPQAKFLTSWQQWLTTFLLRILVFLGQATHSTVCRLLWWLTGRHNHHCAKRWHKFSQGWAGKAGSHGRSCTVLLVGSVALLVWGGSSSGAHILRHMSLSPCDMQVLLHRTPSIGILNLGASFYLYLLREIQCETQLVTQ